MILSELCLLFIFVSIHLHAEKLDEPVGDILQNSRYGSRRRPTYRQQISTSEYLPFKQQRYRENSLEVPAGFPDERQARFKPRNTVRPANLDAQHKCRIWVPADAVDKYEGATKIQMDQIHQTQFIEVCCSGYRPFQWRGKHVCRPVCENCANGYCQLPGECICYDEFVRNDNGDCVFACPLGCQNGRCFLDGSCQCDPGYKLDETRKFCRPICSAGCGQNPRHNCTEPEVCGCAKGYKLTDEGCQPSCQPDCGIGGNCVELNKCECEVGYTLKDGVCQADCYQKCDNGVCYSRNRCICNEGFIYHEHSTQCVPK